MEVNVGRCKAWVWAQAGVQCMLEREGKEEPEDMVSK